MSESHQPRTTVLLLAESPYFGGITTHLLAILDAFQEDRGVRILPATLPGRRRDTAFIDGVRARGLTPIVLPMTHALDTGVLGALRRAVSEHGVDCIHTHNYRATLTAVWAGGGARVLASFHGAVPRPGLRLGTWQALERRAFLRLPRVLACSLSAASLLDARGIPRSRIAIVHNGTAAPSAAAAIPRERLGFTAEQTVFLFAGRLVGGKGVARLIEAAARLERAAVLVVGDGPERGALERLAGSLGVPAHFAGFQADPGPYFAAADAVALASEYEAFPMLLLEAAARGLPAVATDTGGVPEIIADDTTGYLAPLGDTAVLANLMERLCDPETRARLGGAARRQWETRFTLEALARRLRPHYLGAGSAGRPAPEHAGGR